MARPKLAVWKFASCDGCQLSLLDCEDELLAVADAIDIAYFPEATSHVDPGPYELSLVEGSITTPHDAERIRTWQVTREPEQHRAERQRAPDRGDDAITQQSETPSFRCECAWRRGGPRCKRCGRPPA